MAASSVYSACSVGSVFRFGIMRSVATDKIGWPEQLLVGSLRWLCSALGMAEDNESPAKSLLDEAYDPEGPPASSIFLAILFFSGVLVMVFSDIGRLHVAVAEAADSRVNVNTAKFTELDALPGISAATAREIMRGRPYETVDDLLRVKGIGPATLRRLQGVWRVSLPQ
jgi:competence protein ComEA